MKHYYQSSYNTCGPTSLKMILSFYKYYLDEDYLSSLCQTSSLWTSCDDLELWVNYLWWSTIMRNNSTLKDLERYIKNGYKIILWFWYWRSIIWHYAVCKKITKTKIILFDPSKWPEKEYSKYYFQKEMWNLGSHRDWKRWFLAIKFNLRYKKSKEIYKIKEFNNIKKSNG